MNYNYKVITLYRTKKLQIAKIVWPDGVESNFLALCSKCKCVLDEEDLTHLSTKCKRFKISDRVLKTLQLLYKGSK